MSFESGAGVVAKSLGGGGVLACPTVFLALPHRILAPRRRRCVRRTTTAAVCAVAWRGLRLDSRTGVDVHLKSRRPYTMRSAGRNSELDEYHAVE